MHPYNIEEKRPQHPGLTVPEYLDEQAARRDVLVVVVGFAMVALAVAWVLL